MDIFAHAAYGATLFSRSGFSGGTRRSQTATSPMLADWTLWLAIIFSLLPDIVSMGPSFMEFLRSGANGNFFHDFSGLELSYYRYMHSLITATATVLILRMIWLPLFIPSLAWPLHVLMDMFTHGSSKFRTTIFYPISDWGFNGIRWWEHPAVMITYWLLLIGLWFAIVMLRRRHRTD